MPIAANEIKKTISDSINFFIKREQNNNLLSSLSSPDKNFRTNVKTYKTSFFPAVILSCLNNIKKTEISDKLKNEKQKIYNYLIKQKSPHWTFNYWSKEEPMRKEYPYPDDLDDTFCALNALTQFNPRLLTGALWAKIIPILTNCEQTGGGPYRTWLVQNKKENEKWLDIDLAVNANIANFFHNQKN